MHIVFMIDFNGKYNDFVGVRPNFDDTFNMTQERPDSWKSFITNTQFENNLKRIDDDKKEIDAFCVQNFHAGYIRRIRDIASYIRTRYIYDLNMKNLWEATKSAKAAIMSRNMSHNLGSHVMFYIKQKLQSVSKIVDNKVLDNIIMTFKSISTYKEQKIVSSILKE